VSEFDNRLDNHNNRDNYCPAGGDMIKKGPTALYAEKPKMLENELKWHLQKGGSVLPKIGGKPGSAELSLRRGGSKNSGECRLPREF